MFNPALPRRVAAIMVVAVLACILALALAVMAIRDRIDAEAAVGATRLVEAQLASERISLGHLTNDYNHWTEAYERMSARDMGWIMDNYAASAVAGDLFDGLVLQGGPFDAPLGWIAGGPLDPGPSFLPPEIMTRIEAELRALPAGSWEAFDGLAALDGQLVLLAGALTQPQDEHRDQDLDPATLPLAVFADVLDEAELAGTAEALRLDSLLFLEAAADGTAPELGPGFDTLPLLGTDGKALGALAWSPPRPGSTLVTALAPVLVGAGLALLVLGGLAAVLAHALVRRLVLGEAEAQRLARTDHLTGLPNRLAFIEHLGRIEADRIPEAAVLFVDLNGFKSINDSIGHAGGDAVVAGLARRLQRRVGPDAFLARIGGDEFVAVLAGTGRVAARARTLAQEVQAAVAEPFAIMDHEVRVSLSQGMALRENAGTPLSDLVRHADLAMYRAKRDRAGALRSAEPGPGRAPVSAPRPLPEVEPPDRREAAAS